MKNFLFFRSLLDTPVESPESYGINWVGKGGRLERIVFTDRPENRAILAIKKHCGDDSSKFWAICSRYMALGSLPFREPWLVKRNGTVHAHDAVIDAAAEFPLEGNGDFNADHFYKRVAELAATGKYGD